MNPDSNIIESINNKLFSSNYELLDSNGYCAGLAYSGKHLHREDCMVWIPREKRQHRKRKHCVPS